MHSLRAPTWLSAIATATLLCGCAALPNVDAMDRSATAAPTVSNARGAIAPQQANALFEKRWARAALDLKARAALEEAATGVPLIAGNKITLLFDGPQTMQAMMDAAGAATDSINLETYIFDQDDIGLKFADLLIDKQRHGVAVNVLYDSVGTLGTPQAFFDRMRAAGIGLIAFNPVNPLQGGAKWRLNNRDHRKVMIVDGKIAFTGGLNISGTYANSSLFRSKSKSANPKDVGWRDTHIKIEGPAAAALQWMFIDNWVHQEAGELQERNYFPPLAAVGDKIVRVLATKPEHGYEIYKSFVLALEQAKKSIHITCAYFVPDKQVIDALGAAVKRGVDVRLILPGVSDNGVVALASRGFYDELLERGVKIAELQVSVLHAKTAVIDGNWSTVGSSNIDNRSFLYNYELNVVVVDARFGAEMESAYNEDLRHSVEITKARWESRPIGERIKEWAAKLMQNWL